jgi:hypothetical protein
MLSTDQTDPELYALVEQILAAQEMLAQLSREFDRCERQVRSLGLRATTEAYVSEVTDDELPLGSGDLQALQAEVNRNFSLLRGHADRLAHELQALTAG